MLNDSTTFRNQIMCVLFIIYTALHVSAYKQAILRCYLTNYKKVKLLNFTKLIKRTRIIWYWVLLYYTQQDAKPENKISKNILNSLQYKIQFTITILYKTDQSLLVIVENGQMMCGARCVPVTVSHYAHFPHRIAENLIGLLCKQRCVSKCILMLQS
jgi:hypothetical protein